ncbi:MAG: hypothetical protein HY918_01690 [Candidatus Doudnabacteria bacterium]|nr:hypothetical protein [Candidatus Doudnabacteria bacterium]
MNIRKFLAVGVGATLFFCGFMPMGVVKAAAHPAGTNVSNNGTIYMITDSGQRRPYTSAGAFLSYGFNTWATVQAATTEDMALPEGSFIPPRDGKIVCSDRGTDKGTCYLITNGKRAAFVSAQVFTGLGFSFTKALTGDVSFLEKDTDISSSSSQHRSGVLIKVNGTVYLVGSAGLLGVPSMDMLKTWGYSLDDVVNSNDSDSSLTQTSVISGRQGSQLMPGGDNSTPPSNVSESSLIQSYIDTYPNLPTNVISAPQDGAQVIDLVSKIKNLPGSSYDTLAPYLSNSTLELVRQAPSMKKWLESSFVSLAGMNVTGSNVKVFEGGTTALFVEQKKQTGSGYTSETNWVCKKENGVWKWDLLGTYKYGDIKAAILNPSNLYVSGNGTNDISIENAEYQGVATINDPETWILLKIKNNGQNTIHKFDLLVKLNNVIIINETESVELVPQQYVLLYVPIDYYWSLSSAIKTAGNFTTDIQVALERFTTETNVINNKFNFTTYFQQKSTPVVGNLVGN